MIARLALTLGILATVTAIASDARACRTYQLAVPLSDRERERRDNATLVNASDGIFIAQIAADADLSLPVEVPFQPLRPLKGVWPVMLETELAHVTLRCEVVGNHGRYPGAQPGDEVILFLVRDTVFHAEPISSRRGRRLVAMASGRLW